MDEVFVVASYCSTVAHVASLVLFSDFSIIVSITNTTRDLTCTALNFGSYQVIMMLRLLAHFGSTYSLPIMQPSFLLVVPLKNRK